MKIPNNETELIVRPRPTTEIAIRLPEDVLVSLTNVAKHRDMSVEALIRLYVGQGLRQDIAHLYTVQVFDATAGVLAKHLDSPDEVASILEEIRAVTGVPS